MSNAFDGLRELLQHGAVSSNVKPLTKEQILESVRETFEHLGSEEYATRQRESYIRTQEAFDFLDKAFAQGIISQAEYSRLYDSASINGGLVVSLAMAERLRQVQE